MSEFTQQSAEPVKSLHRKNADDYIVKLEDYAALVKENKALRSAGDEMYEYIKTIDGTTNGQLPCIDSWDKAKERTYL